MNKAIKQSILVNFLLLFVINFTYLHATQKRDIYIRVLLHEFDTRKFHKLIIKSNDGFYLESPIRSRKKKLVKNNKIFLITKKNNLYLLCDDGRYRRLSSNDLAITSLSGELHINDKSYQGILNLRINKKNKKLQLINKLHLDDYIYSVLRFESLSFWPLEMQKVQAVASRSYAIYQMKQTRKNKKTKFLYYDIKNTNFHQVYNGNHTCTHLRNAVHDTHNLVLTHKDDIALTMFDICCGGIIPSHMKKKEHSKPYLFRNNRCLFCKNRSLFTWKKLFNHKIFLQKLKSNPKTANRVKHIKKIVNVRIREKDKAGIVHSIIVSGKKRYAILSAKDIKASLKPNIKSLAFTIKKNQNSIILEGHGYGHHIGLCQLGARELVAQGWNYKKILQFYYPKTKLSRLCSSSS